MTQPLIRDRQYGLPQAQKMLKEAYDGKTADLAKDIFSHETIELSTDYTHHLLRKGDWAAVISSYMENPKMKNVSLWSLLKRRKVWDVNITDKRFDQSRCALSPSGLILLPPEPVTHDPYLLVFNGWITELPRVTWDSIHLGRTTVLTSYSVKADTFFSELNQDGDWIWTKKLLPSISGRKVQIHTYSDEYWVRLSGTKQKDIPPVIEVVNIPHQAYKAVELSWNNEKVAFRSACIVRNRLFYGKKEIEEPFKPTIGIFDLVQGVVLAEYLTGAIQTSPKNITANEHFVAWSESKRGHARIKYLNLALPSITTATDLNGVHQDIEEIHVPMLALNLSGSLLIVSYFQFPPGHVKREVFDTVTGKRLQHVRYTKTNLDTISLEDGILLFSGDEMGQKMYIESFIQDFNTQEKSEFRA
jgi:hypothetical protein